MERELKNFHQIHFYEFDVPSQLVRFRSSLKSVYFYLQYITIEEYLENYLGQWSREMMNDEEIVKTVTLCQTIYFHLLFVYKVYQEYNIESSLKEIIQNIGFISQDDNQVSMEFIQNLRKYWLQLPLNEKFKHMHVDDPSLEYIAEGFTGERTALQSSMLITPNFWGPTFWKHIHSMSIVSYGINSLCNCLGQLMSLFDMLLPCVTCQVGFLRKHPYQTITVPVKNTGDSITILNAFHNQVTLSIPGMSKEKLVNVSKLATIFNLRVISYEAAKESNHILIRNGYVTDSNITEAISAYNDPVPTYDITYTITNKDDLYVLVLLANSKQEMVNLRLPPLRRLK